MKKSIPASDPDSFVRALDGWKRDCVEKLRAAVHASARFAEVIKWGNLVYRSNGPVLLIRAEHERVLLGFWRGKRLGKIEPRLKPGRKYGMAALEIREGVAVSSTKLRRLAKEAAMLNKTLGDPTRVGQ